MGRRDSRYQRTSSEVRARRYLYQMRPYTEERCEGQLSCTVLDWRWGGRPPRRPYGKKRPLGGSSGAQQLVQEVVTIILARIYDPVLLSSSHRFPTRHSPRTRREKGAQASTATFIHPTRSIVSGRNMTP